nr:unnamed protein product [Spirometra erinaceieuropaei]
MHWCSHLRGQSDRRRQSQNGGSQVTSASPSECQQTAASAMSALLEHILRANQPRRTFSDAMRNPCSHSHRRPRDDDPFTIDGHSAAARPIPDPAPTTATISANNEASLIARNNETTSEVPSSATTTGSSATCEI